MNVKKIPYTEEIMREEFKDIDEWKWYEIVELFKPGGSFNSQTTNPKINEVAKKNSKLFTKLFSKQLLRAIETYVKLKNLPQNSGKMLRDYKEN